MFQWLAKALIYAGQRLKGNPSVLAGTQWSGAQTVDKYHKHRNPTPNELMAELKGTAWACASLNAAACANYPPSLYVATSDGQPEPKCGVRPINSRTLDKLHGKKTLAARIKNAAKIQQVTDHPLLSLLQFPTAPLNVMGPYDLWELTTLYQEVHGSAYWYLERDNLLGMPVAIWILPSQNMKAMREKDSPNFIDYWQYRIGSREQQFDPNDIVHFRYPDPRDPYTGGLSPLRAAFEQVTISSHFSAFKTAKFDNQAVPDAVVSPDEVVGEEERDRLEAQWAQKFKRGGAGRVLVTESKMQIQLLQHSMGDLALLADMNLTKTDIANAFHLPIAYLTTQTNLANLFASIQQHMQQAISPRLERRDEKLNNALVPMFDPSGRLFLASEDPVPTDQSANIAQQEADLNLGVLTINEIRAGRGLPPVPWGQVPWLSSRLMPADVARPNTNPSIDSTDPESADPDILAGND